MLTPIKDGLSLPTIGWIQAYFFLAFCLALFGVVVAPKFATKVESATQAKVLIDSLQIMSIIGYLGVGINLTVRKGLYLISLSFLNFDLVSTFSCDISSKNLMLSQLLLPVAIAAWMALFVGGTFLFECVTKHKLMRSRWRHLMYRSTGSMIAYLSFQYVALSFISFHISHSQKWTADFYNNIVLLIAIIGAFLYGIIVPALIVYIFRKFGVYPQFEAYIVQLGIFVMPYQEPSRLKFECFNIGRKISTTAVAVWLSGNSVFQSMSLIFVYTSWIIIHGIMRKYVYVYKYAGYMEIGFSVVHVVLLLAAIPPFSQSYMKESIYYSGYVIGSIVILASLVTAFIIIRRARVDKQVKQLKLKVPQVIMNTSWIQTSTAGRPDSKQETVIYVEPALETQAKEVVEISQSSTAFKSLKTRSVGARSEASPSPDFTATEATSQSPDPMASSEASFRSHSRKISRRVEMGHLNPRRLVVSPKLLPSTTPEQPTEEPEKEKEKEKDADNAI